MPLPALHKRFAQAAVKMVTAPTGPVAALSERPVGSNSTAGGHWCTSRSPDVSLRGAKRRGNLGKAVAVSPVAFPRCGRVLRDCHVGLRPPRNDKSKAFAILTVACTDCKCVAGRGMPLPALHKRFAQAAVKMVTAPTGPVAALSERPVGSNSTAGGHWCTSRSPDVSLRGAKRRGNLAVPSRITGHSRRNRDCLPEIATSAVGLLAMTNRRPAPF